MVWTSRQAAAMFQSMLEERHREMGRRVRDARLAKAWSQPDLAHRAGVSPQTISRMERAVHEGRTHTVTVVAQALDLTVGELLPPGPPAPREQTQLDHIEEMLAELLTLVREQDAAEVEAELDDAPLPAVEPAASTSRAGRAPRKASRSR